MRRVTLLLCAALGLWGCEAPKTRSKQMRQWLSKSRRGCEATASVLKKIRRGVAAFEAVYDAEFKKTQQDRRPLKRYNPQFLTRLAAALGPVDTTKPPLADGLANDVWPSHYRFVKRAPEVLPRLHRLLVLLAELRSSVTIARRLEKRYRPTLALKILPRKRSTTKYVVLIKSDRLVQLLAAVPPPLKPARDPGGNPGGKPPLCKDYHCTTRALAPNDAELMNRVQCRGREQIVYTAYLYHLMQIKLILASIKKLDLRGLTIAFSRSAN